MKPSLDHASTLVSSSMDTTTEQSFSILDGCSVLCPKPSTSFLFSGLANGKVAVYHKDRLVASDRHQTICDFCLYITLMLNRDNYSEMEMEPR